MTNGSGLASVDHVVVLMLENRSRRYPAGVTAPPPPGPLSA